MEKGVDLKQNPDPLGQRRGHKPTRVWGRWRGWAEQAEAIWQLDGSQEADVASVPLA